MQWIKEYMDIRYKKHLKDWDTVVCIAGDEGVSKSNLAEHKVDYWKTLTKGKCKSSDVKHISLTGKDFVNDLSDAEAMDCPCFDEAGELDSRRAMSNFNVMLSQAYKVIRADRLYTILVLPNIWDLELRFIRRMKALFLVYRRGHVAVWLKDSLRRMAEINSFRKIKSYWVVPPDFYDNFPIYKGPMAEEYKKKKTQKTREARENLKGALNGERQPKKDINREEVASKLYEYGLTQKEIGGVLNIHQTLVGRLLKEKD